MALDTESATTSMVIITVLFDGASRPKLTKMTASQRTSMTSNGTTIDTCFCADKSQSVLLRSTLSLSASALSDRWSSSRGASCWIESYSVLASATLIVASEFVELLSGHRR